MPWGRGKGIEDESFRDHIFKEQGWKSLFWKSVLKLRQEFHPRSPLELRVIQTMFPKVQPRRKGLGVWVRKGGATKFHTPCPNLRWVKSKPPCWGRDHSIRPRLRPGQPQPRSTGKLASVDRLIDFPHDTGTFHFQTPMWVDQSRWEQKDRCHCLNRGVFVFVFADSFAFAYQTVPSALFQSPRKNCWVFRSQFLPMLGISAVHIPCL